MKESAITKTVKDAINPEMKKDIPYNAVKFGNSWTFWETYT